MNPTILVIWIAAALLCYVVARNKGRDPVVAIAMGLLLGFFALIYYMLAKGSKEYEVKRAKELIHSSEFREPEEKIEAEHHRTYKKTDNNAPGCLVVILLTIGGFIGIFVIGAIASALSNKSNNTQTYPTYQNNDNGSVSNTIPQQPISNKYPEITRTTSVASCMKLGGNKRYCECALEYWEAHYTLEEYAGMQEELKNNKIPPALYEAANACQRYK